MIHASAFEKLVSKSELDDVHVQSLGEDDRDAGD